MRHLFAIEKRGRQDAGTRRCARCSTEGELLRPVHAGRYFGGFWFKVFCERGPC